MESLRDVLLAVSRQEYALDEKLADYAFFPLSHIFRETRDLPSRVLELALQCLKILLESAWRHKLSANLGIQLLILLGFLAGRSPAQAKSTEVSEELTLAVFECLHSLFDSLGRSGEGKRSLTDTANVPALGHTITVLLDGVGDAVSDKNQQAALAALDALISCLGDREAVASFFPGMVSALNKALQSTTRSKRSYRFLEAGINLFTKLLQMVISDEAVAELNTLSKAKVKKASVDATSFGPSWVKATAAQIKLALANIVRLRNHERDEVRHALRRLCVTVLEDCKESLAESTAMIIETLVTISATDEAKGNGDGQSVLKHVAYTDSKAVGLIKASVHSWTRSLPRIMQSNDDSAKSRIASQISTSIKLLSDLESQTDMLNHDVAISLRDSILSLLPAQTSSKGLQSQPESCLQLLPANGQEPSKTFSPILLSQRAEQETLLTLSSLVRQLSGLRTSDATARVMLDEARSSTGNALLANFWLCLNFLRNSSSTQTDMDFFLELDPSTSLTRANFLEELYSLSLQILSTNTDEDEPDWRLQALALEAVALQCSQLGPDFRPELVDALYPIVHLMGAAQPALRDHAITCLNMVAASCDYASTSALIIDNVDYLVNAVALKLNTFDISPQAPQVLSMMIRLCGASLIPYLDDLVGSVFAALESFHGYPRLVELLFAVLGAIVDEGAKSPVLALTSGKEIDRRKKPWQPRTISDLAKQLKQARENPQNYAETDIDLDNPNQPPSTDITTPSLHPTLKTLHSITTLTKHYLPHASPTLRSSLLHLISTASKPLSSSENDFLPLVATLWPLVTRRLHDSEPYVVVAATEAVTTLCECAGDFVATRVEGEWGGWREMFGRLGARLGKGDRSGGGSKGRANARTLVKRGGDGGRGVYSVNYRLWDAWVRMLVAVVRYVRISDEMFDDLLEMVGECLETRRDVREALEVVNSDAVWLEMERRGMGAGAGAGEVPVVEGFEFKSIEF